MNIREANKLAQNSMFKEESPQQYASRVGGIAPEEATGQNRGAIGTITSQIAQVGQAVTPVIAAAATAATATYEAATGDNSGTLFVMDTKEKADSYLEDAANTDGASGVVQGVKSVASGIAAGSAEIIAGAKTVYATATGDTQLRDEAEADRNTTIKTLDEYRNADEAGLVNNITYGLSKYMSVPGGAAAAAGKLGLGVIGATGVVAATTGAISGQETKQDLMNKGVSREDANTAAAAMGIGMSLLSVIPVAGLGSIKSAAAAAKGVAASTVAATGLMSGTQYGTGAYLRRKGYEKEGKEFQDMAFDPVSVGLSVVLSASIGAVVGRGALKQYRADMSYLKSESQSSARTFSPEEIQAANEAGFGTQELPTFEDAKSNILTREALEDKPVREPTPEEIQTELTQITNERQAQINEDISSYLKYKDVSDASYQTLVSSGLLTTSDRNIIMSNERNIQEFMDGRIDRVELESRLEIPQVHRDQYALTNVGNITKNDVIDSYFDVDGLVSARDGGYSRPPLHMANVSNRPVETSTGVNLLNRVLRRGTEAPVKNNIMDTIATGEGNYNSYNRGNAGDSSAPLPISSYTIGEIMSKQAKDELFAVGRYQVIPNTMIAAMKFLKLNPNTKFTPEVQDMIFRQFLVKDKRRPIYDYISGKNDDLVGAQVAMSQEFASVGVPAGVVGKAKDTSYYSGVGNNKAAIKSDKMGTLLKEQKSRYAKYKSQGRSDAEAWELSFKGDTLTGYQPSGAITQAKGVRSVGEGGKVYENDYTRNRIREYDESGEEITIPKRGVWSNIRDGFIGDQSVYDRVLGEKLYSEPLTGDKSVDAEIKARTELSRPLAETRAIQAAFEEVSYQHALEAKQRALDNGFTPKEASNILQNTYRSHQANLKIGQSKMFNEEYTRALAQGLDDKDAISQAYSNVGRRLLTTAALGNVRVAPKAPEDTIIRVGKSEYKLVPDDTKTTTKASSKEQDTVKKALDESMVTKVDEITTTKERLARTVDDQTIRLAEMTARIAGRDRTVTIAPNGERSVRGSTADIYTVINRSPDNINIEGKTYTKEEARTLLEQEKSIDVDEFINCALS